MGTLSGPVRLQFGAAVSEQISKFTAHMPEQVVAKNNADRRAGREAYAPRVSRIGDRWIIVPPIPSYGTEFPFLGRAHAGTGHCKSETQDSQPHASPPLRSYEQIPIQRSFVTLIV